MKTNPGVLSFLRWAACFSNQNNRLLKSVRKTPKAIAVVGFVLLIAITSSAQKINRQQVVTRHNITINQIDSLSSLTVGNGNFAFTVDATGMQSFPEVYAKGVPLGTQSVWGWHRFPNSNKFTIEQAQKIYELEGKKISYTVQRKDSASQKAVEYFRGNPHRLQLGNIGLEVKKKNGSLATANDIKNIQQQLNLWTGIITSNFTVEDIPVKVITVCHQQSDAVSFKIESDLLQQNRLQIRVRFPSPNGLWKDVGDNWNEAAKQSSLLTATAGKAIIKRILNTTTYYAALQWNSSNQITQLSNNYFVLPVSSNKKSVELTCYFNQKNTTAVMDNFYKAKWSSILGWQTFWLSGGAIDFSAINDARAFEIERRVVLSQYLTKLQCSSQYPPQETGLTYNSWYGKPHLEMQWWHAVHFAQWGRVDLMEKSLNWYFSVANKAMAIAKRQGFEGLRWQKMTDNEGNESPSSVGAFLIWQQPHFIYMAELLYRAKPTKQILNKYQQLLFATANFMASFPSYNQQTKKYNLGKGVIPAQECFVPEETYNPTYELAYWSWALQKAQQWRKRLGLPPHKKWQAIIDSLAPLPQHNNLYLAAENTPNCYEPNANYLNDHPAVLATYASLPAVHNLDTVIMKNTLDTVLKIWNWNKTWGWDFPLVAMTAARLHLPNTAMNALLMPIKTNTYLINGNNYQDERLTIYLPGNGALLTAVAFMCTGADIDKQTNIGFPKNWKIKWEGLMKLF